MQNQPNSPEAEDQTTRLAKVTPQEGLSNIERSSSAGKDPLHQQSEPHQYKAPPKKDLGNGHYHSIEKVAAFSFKKVTLKVIFLYAAILALSVLLVIIF